MDNGRDQQFCSNIPHLLTERMWCALKGIWQKQLLQLHATTASVMH